MPILWRYLLKNYFRVFLLSIFVFLSILVLMRMQEIARFATLGTAPSVIALFILLQFPIILPLAIPISALISSTILMMRLCQSHELTSLRVQGLSVKDILYPIKMTAFFLTLFNFVIVSELTPTTRLKSKNLMYQATAQNPLLLMQTNKITKVKNAYTDLHVIKSGKSAENLIFSFLNPSSKKMNLIMADQLNVEDQGILIGEQVHLISHLKTKQENGFDHLVIENYDRIENSSLAIASLLHQTDIKRLSLQRLRIKPLLIKMFVEKERGQLFRCILEISRRTFLSWITYAFTMLGAIFSIQIGRTKRKTGVLWILLLSSLTFAFYLIAKSTAKNHAWALIFYLIPLCSILIANRLYRFKIERGLE
ncbi:MAG: LptF/LptG family permease [Simkaniaceae bacterium]|nr:LptF/LptG family permease [Simkaniaceae bacterium]